MTVSHTVHILSHNNVITNDRLLQFAKISKFLARNTTSKRLRNVCSVRYTGLYKLIYIVMKQFTRIVVLIRTFADESIDKVMNV